MIYKLSTTNQTDAQVRESAYRNYKDASDDTLKSVVRMNAGTMVREKGITREVAQELLAERQA